MRRRLFVLVCVSIVATLALAACNGDDDGDDGNGNGNGNGDGQEVSMDMGEFYFDPDELEGSAGEEITIELENTGSQVHTFTLEEGDARGDGFDAWPDSGVDHELDEGETETFTLTLPDEAGEYEFICRIPGHYEAGQWGTLTVN
jgi:uncharacterized cupredoxin-like copper-binding protein